MPVQYTIYKEQRLVVSTGDGRLTFDDVRAHQDRLLSDPDFNPEFDQLMDFTRFTDVDLSVSEIRMAANRKLFSPTSRRALVVAGTFMYGMARMFQAYYEMSKTASPSGVFRDLPSALKWLGREKLPVLAHDETKRPDTAEDEGKEKTA